MVDRLKSSLEQLPIPICPNCLIKIRWVRSTLVAAEPVAIEHHFSCPSCDRVAKTTTTLPSGSEPRCKRSPNWRPTAYISSIGDKPVRLGSRAFDILAALVERAGDVVGKERLIARAWLQTHIEESNLKIQNERSAPRPRRRPWRHRYVATVPGRGYSFVAPCVVKSRRKPRCR